MKKQTLAGDILDSLSRYFAVLVIAVVLVILCSGIRFVKSGEVALVFRFGRLTGETREEQVHEPGLLLAFPYIIDEVVTVPTGKVMKLDVTTHYTPTMMSGYTHNGYVITGDANVIMLSASVQYMIDDPVQYALYVSEEDKLIRGFVSTAMIQIAASMSADELLTSGKTELASRILSASAKSLAEAETGLVLTSVELTNVTMPFELKDIYDTVTSARVTAKTLAEQAAQYRETVIPAAEADAAALISAASAQKADAIARANASLAEFRGILEEYNRDGEAVKVRVYHQKLTEITQKIGKIRIVGDGDSRIVLGEG